MSDFEVKGIEPPHQKKIFTTRVYLFADKFHCVNDSDRYVKFEYETGILGNVFDFTIKPVVKCSIFNSLTNSELEEIKQLIIKNHENHKS